MGGAFGRRAYRPASVQRIRVGLNASGMPVSWENRVAGPSNSGYWSPTSQHKGHRDPPEKIPYAIANRQANFGYLPAPVPIGAWRVVNTQNAFCVEGTQRLESRTSVEVHAGPDITFEADGDQLEQLLSNLIANATDSVLASGGGVVVSWRKKMDSLEISVVDAGAGIGETTNLFVPFFTTKAGWQWDRTGVVARGSSILLCHRTWKARKD